MIGLGCPEVVILGLMALVFAGIGLRVLRRKRAAEKPPEDDAGW